MAKVTDKQRAVLDAAVRRVDGAALAPEGWSKSACSKVGASLVARKLMREIRQKGDLPVWRVNEDGKSISLVLTRAGRNAVSIAEAGVGNVAATTDKRRGEDHPASKIESRASLASIADRGSSAVDDTTRKYPAPTITLVEHTLEANAQPRAGSKQALLVEMISKPEGATIGALNDATGWLPHTTRAALTGLRKRGYAIRRLPQQDAPSLYVIGDVSPGSQSTAADSRA